MKRRTLHVGDCTEGLDDSGLFKIPADIRLEFLNWSKFSSGGGNLRSKNMIFNCIVSLLDEFFPFFERGEYHLTESCTQIGRIPH